VLSVLEGVNSTVSRFALLTPARLTSIGGHGRAHRDAGDAVVRSLGAAAVADAHVDVHPLVGHRAAHPEANLGVRAGVVFAPVVAQGLDEVLVDALAVPDEALLPPTSVGVWLSQVTMPPSLLLRRLASSKSSITRSPGVGPASTGTLGAQALPLQVFPDWHWLVLVQLVRQLVAPQT
jgi:hypothetical protein